MSTLLQKRNAPDLAYAEARGWITYPAKTAAGGTGLNCALPHYAGLTTRGTPRINAPYAEPKAPVGQAKTFTEYTRLRRERLHAAGLTSRGTLRKMA
jgi:hypothetical protein